jgi:hypothetical protein
LWAQLSELPRESFLLAHSLIFLSSRHCSSIFAANLAKIEAHNAGDHSWKMGE